MHKVVVGSLVTVVCVLSTPAFAQFKNPGKAVANLERAVTRATKSPVLNHLSLKTPQGMTLFRCEQIWKTLGLSKKFTDLNALCDATLLTHLHKVRLDQVGASVDVKKQVKANQAAVYRQLNDTDSLLSFLQQLPRVCENTKGFKAYVVELPVEGLVWEGADGALHVYHPKDYVMLVFEMGSVGIYPRADVENPALFEPLEPRGTAPASPEKLFTAHPQNDLWRLYEEAKISWGKDRQNDLFESLWKYAYPRQFNSQAELGRALDSFHRKMTVAAYQKETKTIGYVYEIPVKGLTCRLEGTDLQPIDPEKYVFFYNDQNGGELIPREDMENALLYEFKQLK